jgi:hypothetical protein
MKIITIDLSEIWGIKHPETGEEYEWETGYEINTLHESSFISAVFPDEFPDDTTYSKDEEFTSKWLAFYEENQTRVDEASDEECIYVQELLEEFESPHIVLELTSYGMACGPVSFTQYFILEKKYESQLDSLFLKNTD